MDDSAGLFLINYISILNYQSGRDGTMHVPT